jgi:hypothetical protein
MKHLFFWNNWHSNYKNLYLGLLSLLGIILITLGYFRFMGLDAAITWEMSNTVQSLPVIIDQFNKGIMNYSVQADAYLVYQNFKAGDIQLIPILNYIYLGIIIIMFSLFMAAISSLKSNWYYLFIAIAVGILISFKFDLIEVFGLKNDTVVAIAVALYLAVSYYLVAFNRNVTLIQQFLIFLVLSAVIFGTILLGAKVNEPALHLVSYGSLAPIVITVLLILLTAYDNIQVFLYLITGTSNASTKGNAGNFILITGLYLLNIVLIYLKMANTFEFDILYVDVMIVFITSVIAGIWGFRKRSELFSNILPFEIQGAIVYMCMAIIGSFTVLVHLASANTPMINFFENVVVYAQISMGFMFLAYILANFAVFLLKNQKVHLIVYKPQKLPFAMVPALGLVIFGSLFMKGGMILYDQVFAGYYNAIADNYKTAKSDFLAEEYYKKGKEYAHFNFKSNYSLGCIARNLGNAQLSVYYFEDATHYPNEYAYINLANSYDENENLLSKLESLKEGHSAFPKSSKISNNLALVFRKTNITDSTMFYFKKARVNEEEAALTNLLAFAIEKGADNLDESILKDEALEDYDDAPALQANKLFIYNKLNKKYDNQYLSYLFKDSTLNENNFAYFINYQLSQIKNNDTTVIPQIKTYIKKDTSNKFGDDLKYLKSAKYYYYGNKSKGISEMYDLINNGTYNTGLYANTLGLWMMEQDAYGLAIDFFKISKEKQNKTAGINLALAYSENGNFVEAYDEWSIVKTSKNKAEYDIAMLMLPIVMNASLDQVMQWDDRAKSQFIHYRRNYFTKTEIGTLFNSLKDDLYKIQACVDMMDYYTQFNSPEQAISLYNLINTNYKLEPAIAITMNGFYVKALLQIQDYKSAEASLKSKTLKSDSKEYFLAIVAEKKNQYKIAKTLYEKVADNNPFNAEANIDAAAFFSNKINDQNKAYAILVNAVRNNPQSVAVYKAYCLQAIKSGLFNFADDALGYLKKYIDANDYNQFKLQYDAALDKALN